VNPAKGVALVAVAMIGLLVISFGGDSENETLGAISNLAGLVLFIGGIGLAFREARSSRDANADNHDEE
jgi:hypothetical protein